MYATMYSPGILLLTLCAFLSVPRQALCQQDAVLRALADHTDRLTDLEALVQNFTSTISGMSREMAMLHAENTMLKHTLQILTSSCSKCCTCSHATQNTYNNHSHTQPATTTPGYATTTTMSPDNLSTTGKWDTTTYNWTPSTTAPTTTTMAPTTAAPTTPQPTTPQPTTTTTAQRTTTVIQEYDSCDAAYTPGVFVKTANIRQGSDVMTTVCEHAGGRNWLVIQRRMDGSVDFDRTWDEYKKGFGQPPGEFWLGNEHIHELTGSGDYTLRIDMQDWDNNWSYAEYEHFRLGSQYDEYRLYVGGYSGNAGDSFHYPNSPLLQHHLMPFSAKDADHDKSSVNCAQELHAGWWFDQCYSSNLNGPYLNQPTGVRQTGEAAGEPTLEGTGIEWYPYKQQQYSLRRVEMKIALIPSQG